MQNLDRATLLQMYPNVVDDAVNTFFRLFSQTPAIRRAIVELVYGTCLSNELTDNRLGIVITGYGRTEYYPSIFS
jgi:hypothetical protein